jgi:hypothetical protein
MFEKGTVRAMYSSWDLELVTFDCWEVYHAWWVAWFIVACVGVVRWILLFTCPTVPPMLTRWRFHLNAGRSSKVIWNLSLSVLSLVRWKVKLLRSLASCLCMCFRYLSVWCPDLWICVKAKSWNMGVGRCVSCIADTSWQSIWVYLCCICLSSSNSWGRIHPRTYYHPIYFILK